MDMPDQTCEYCGASLITYPAGDYCSSCGKKAKDAAATAAQEARGPVWTRDTDELVPPPPIASQSADRSQGAPRSPKERPRYCEECGRSIGPTDKFCESCGTATGLAGGTEPGPRARPVPRTQAQTTVVPTETRLGPGAAFKRAWAHSFDWSGRARRREYWHFFWMNVVITTVLDFLAESTAAGDPDFSALMAGVSVLYSLASLPANIGVGVRRLHDTNRRGWWVLLLIVNIFFLATNGHAGTNRFGPDPKQVPRS